MEAVFRPVGEMCVPTCRSRESIFLFVCELAIKQVILKAGP